MGRNASVVKGSVLPVNVMGHSSAKTSSSIPLKLRTSRTALWPAVTLPSACGSHSKRPTTTVFSTKVVRSNLNVKPVPLARGIAQLDTMVQQRLQPQCPQPQQAHHADYMIMLVSQMTTAAHSMA